MSAASRIGYPVVVKPYNGNHGRGVSINLTDADQVDRRLPRGAGDQPQRHRREVHRGARPPHAGGERPAHRRVEADAGPCGGRRHAHDRRAGGRGEPRPAARHRAREGADADRLRLPGGAPAGGARPDEGLGAGGGAGGLPAHDGEPVHRRHRRGRHRHRAPGQRRDGGARDQRDRARRRRRGLPEPGHRGELQGHRRRHLRGERGAGIPDAHGALERQAARRGGPGARHAVRARQPEQDPDRRADRHQRQDDDGAHAGAHHEARGPPCRADHDRRRVRRRPAHRRGRHDRPGGDAHGAERPVRGRGGAGDGARRPAARRHGRAALRRRCRAQREVGPPRHEGHRHARGPGPGQADHRRDRARHGGAQRRRPALPQDGRLHRGEAPLLRDDEPGAPAGAGAHLGRRARRGAGDGDEGPDDHDLRSWRPHSAALDAPHPGDARGPGGAQRPERHVRRRDGVLDGREAGEHPPRAPYLRHLVLPGPRAG